MKFSALDGFMQYIDKHWDTPCQGIDLPNFLQQCHNAERGDRKSARTKFYDNYTK